MCAVLSVANTRVENSVTAKVKYLKLSPFEQALTASKVMQYEKELGNIMGIRVRSPYVLATINGRSFKALLDTRADINVIRRSALEAARYPIQSSPTEDFFYNLITANGSQFGVYG